ncbi:MAG TPA: hypothetical protein P5013_04055 [Methanoregula sp.]|nr:hypothetical protein [Methanoregula sp.]
MDEVKREIESVGGVYGVHNVHLWTPCSNINVLDAHGYYCETDARRFEEIKAEINRRPEKFRIRHSTLEFEWHKCGGCRIVQELRD